MPLGEFRLAPSLVAELLGKDVAEVPSGGPARWRWEEEAYHMLGVDAVGVLAGASSAPVTGTQAEEGARSRKLAWAEEVAYWAGREFFLWVIVDGPWQGLAATLGWSRALLLCSSSSTHGSTEELERRLLMQLEHVLAAVERALEAGADGIVLGEDVAYADGLLISPAVIGRRLLPLWREVVLCCGRARTARGERPLVVFHCDGRFEDLMPMILEAGFDAVHSLQPETGMRPDRLLSRYRGRLGFWGGLSVELLLHGHPQELAAEGRRLARAARAGGLVVGSSSGVVPEGVRAANLLAVYRAVATSGSV